MSSCLTETENALLGGVTAVTIAVTLQPTLYWKNARQQNLPLTLDPRLLYRGMGPQLANEIGQLGLAFGATSALKQALPATPSGELTAASAAGALVALFASPCELLMIQQQRHGTGVFETPLRVLRSHGLGILLGRGLGMAMARDAIYVGGMLGATPVCSDWLIAAMGRSSSRSSTSEGDSSSSSAVSAGTAALASLAASMLGGIIAAIPSHPLDVIKTCQQGDLEATTYKGPMQTAKALVKEGGLWRLLNGVTWRTVNIVTTVWIANEMIQRLPPYVKAVTRRDESRVS